jgi:hypothetical protein
VKYVFDKAVTVEYSKDAALATTASARTIQFNGDGVYTLSTATDAYGNTLALDLSFTISAAKPNLTLTANSDGKRVASGALLTADLTFGFVSSVTPYTIQVSRDGVTWESIAGTSPATYTIERANDINGVYQFRGLNAASGAIGAPRAFTVNFEQVPVGPVIPNEVIAAAQAAAASGATSFVDGLVFQTAWDWANEGIVDMARYTNDHGPITEQAQYPTITAEYYKHVGAYNAVRPQLIQYALDNGWYSGPDALTLATDFMCFLMAVGAVGDAGYEDSDRALLQPLYAAEIAGEYHDLYYQSKYDEIYDAYIADYLA